MGNGRIAVIGAVNIDICGTSFSRIGLHDSNPGRVSMSYGGVGRNIAENLCRLGEKVEMITVLGDDAFTRDLVEYSGKLGIDFSHSLRVPGASCSTYVSINDNSGDMLSAISDMSIYENMTVDDIASRMDIINSCDMAVCDTNIPEPVLRYISENSTVPLAVDPVSMTKAMKLKDIIGRFTIIKPNIYESEFLTGIRAVDDLSLKANSDFYHSLGVKYVFISLGEKGCFYSDGEKCGIMPVCKKYELVNASGCGDAFLASVLRTYMNGEGVDRMAKAGVCAAAVCGHSTETVSPQMDPGLVDQLMNE